MSLVILIVVLSLALWFFSAKSKNDKELQNQNIEDFEVAEIMRVVDQSIEIVNNSKNPGTRISRVDVAIDKLAYLNQRFPHREDIEKALNDADAYRFYLHTAIVEEKIEKLLDRSKLAKTLSGKLNSANKALEALKEANSNKYVDQKKVVESVAFIKKYMHHEELKNIETKAERYEFKGNYKKALSFYQDALFFLRKDEIDDSLQANDIKRLEQKIEKLKQKVTTPKFK